MKRFYGAITIISLLYFGYVLNHNPSVIVNPGDLIPAHQRLHDQCFACHTPFKGTPGEKCISCHKVETIGLAVGKKLLSTEIKRAAVFHKFISHLECVQCHSDHGKVPSKLFFGDFSHAFFPTEIKENCIQCHEKPNNSLHQSTTSSCLQCHNQRQWKPAFFDHSKYFVFDKHHPNQCNTCHGETITRAYTCYSCHEHTPQKIAREHLKERIQNFDNCVKCHRSGSKEGLENKRDGGEMQREDDDED